MGNHQHQISSGLKIAFGLNLCFTILEFFGGWLSGSIAILSDAVHDLGDTVSLGLALVMARIAERSNSSDRYSYGKRRWSLLGALVNALVLVFGSALILREAILRLQSPAEAKGLWMFFFAVLGVSVNGFAAYRNSKGKTLNERVISWHLLEDVIGWATVLIGAVILMLTDWHWIDPALAIAISIFILFNILRRLREVIVTFLQGVPNDVDLGEVRARLSDLKDIESIHDLHAWSLDGEHHVVSCHAILPRHADIAAYFRAKEQLRSVLNKDFSGSITIELEFQSEPCPQREQP